MSLLEEDKYKFLEELLITPSPTGFESAGQNVWKEYIDQYADEVQSDAYGSVSARLNVNYDVMTVMLEAHADEIGMIVQHITEKGFIYVNKLGGSDPTITKGKQVHIHTRDGIVTGVIGNTAIHLRDSGKKEKQPQWKDVFIDIGASSQEEANKMVQIGDPITYTDEFEFLTDDKLTGRALDNRVGGFMIAQVFKRLQERRDELNVNVLVLNSVQEEIGGYGARMMSFRHSPDLALVTDVTHATDTPGINNKDHGLVKIGNGPTVTHGSANHPKVVEMIEQVARRQEIEIQHEASSVRTGTDTDSIFYQRTGIPSGLISLPLRYMHSPVETVSLQDMESLVQLMTETVIQLEPDQAFTVV